MAAPYTAEDLDALRELSEYEDMMGLGARRLLATIDAVTAERDALRASLEALRYAVRHVATVPCDRCGGRGVLEIDCHWCSMSSRPHKCPPPHRCALCDGEGAMAPLSALRALLGGE